MVAAGATRVTGEGIRIAAEDVGAAGRTAGLLLGADHLRAADWSADRSRPGCSAAAQTSANIGRMIRPITAQAAARTKAACLGWKSRSFMVLSPV
jgi:hypothetical protein